MKEGTYHIPTHLQQQISSEQAFHYRIVPVGENEDSLVLKTDTASLDTLLTELNIILEKPVTLQACETKELQKYLFTNYRLQATNENASLSYTKDFLEKILLTGKSIGSSDIHFEPYEERCRIRFRLDGKLIERYSIPMLDYPTMVNKIKIRANLDIAEKRLPQDGRITVKSYTDEFDIRVSSLPTLHGEKLVLRILSRDTGKIALEQLGFSKTELERYQEGIKKPNGIVLISGPTGSGKTTTLYATLKTLNNEKTNIVTIEDPIEYTLEGVNQVQLKENIGLDFASSLKTFLRQDPDVIMVGEIRDVNTANMAIRAALTGHLVLSTIHTNSAWATISRLVDMGVPPFLIANTLNMSVAQRLVRKLCNACKQEKPIAREFFPKNFKTPPSIKKHFVPTGCDACHHTGYSGRKAIYEIVPITKTLYGPIIANELQIDEYLIKEQIATLKKNAIAMVEQGITSIEEVYTLLTN
ncbi:GspE/PulE family protein [Flagellimonas meridianipacifica]|uniref:Type IV pilus assembly protein PilB n=1 Tax=Flagellimonas meridianipacifica TaxID=1080225 RepID=A0A2T0MI65_9FLAO|nr:GspE/PulE family protein [Allomuricauda pacifica]PRX57206.1 type IV pilus assembly protein PilB [Allomuricauda pacifica]